ncbi:SMI1/KNR4 family protein [Saccharibacillus sp. JS10]|uniref:HEAT repeat domain-containing protein n=1 Tax=Saccharibacillus sp. JS10 TaxID=2950552 RepID=UPI00210C20AB|nr:SMI1/KNR4 family protein [Saccharibacillus sp. JS10]MCQ4085685.1 hypothetical protein [Saccharibacillus sp. JS10]
MNKQAQLERILWKLKMATKRDPNFKEFGAKRHRYESYLPLEQEQIEIFEAQTQVTLPQEFAEFLKGVGNGGAGPYHGIRELDLESSPELLQQDCLLSPKMTRKHWQALIAYSQDHKLELYGGMLGIGSMGWTFEMMLVLNGPYRGRVVYIDHNEQIPFFTYEANFLEWYERWLDEVIGGYDLGWFATKPAGDDMVLIDLYLSSLEEQVKVSAIQGMYKLPKLKTETLSFLFEQCTDSSKIVRNAAIEILAQKNYEQAIPFLRQALSGPLIEERLNAARQIDMYGEPGGGELTSLIQQKLMQEEDPELFCQLIRILERGSANPLNALIPFFTHPDPELRREAIFHAGRLPGKEVYATQLGEALDDTNQIVQETAVCALEGVPLPSLLAKYGKLIALPSSGVTLRKAVLSRLSEYGKQAYSFLEQASTDSDAEIREEARHLLRQYQMML